MILFFWSGSTTASDVVELSRACREKYADGPLSILGVNCDQDLTRARAVVEKGVFPGSSFRDGQGGPIATAWNVRSLAYRIVVDAQGRIHYRSGYERDIEAAVDALFAEASARAR